MNSFEIDRVALPSLCCSLVLYFTLVSCCMELLRSAAHAGIDKIHRRRWVSENPLPLVNPHVVLRLLMTYCSMIKSGDNQYWWISGCFSGSCAIVSSEGIYVHSSGKIDVQKLQRRVSFHTGFEGEGPSRLCVHI